MDKKLLVSLMMTAPVAALANDVWVTDGSGNLSYKLLAKVNNSNWMSQGSAQFTTAPDGALVCPVSAGHLTHNNQAIAIGTYTFNVSAGAFENAILKINGKWQAKTNDAGKFVNKDGKAIADNDYANMVPVFPTTLKLTGSLSIEVWPQDRAQNFKVGEITFALEFNFATVKNDFQVRLDGITESIVPIEENADNAILAGVTALRTQYNGLLNTSDQIQTCIDAIDLADGDKLYLAYTTYSLNKWNVEPGKSNDGISVQLNSFNTSVASYNKDANAKNLQWNNYVKNTADLNRLNGEVIQLRSNLNNKQTELDQRLLNDPAADQLGEYCKFITQDDIDNASASIDRYQTKINTAYSDLFVTINIESETADIQAMIDAIDYDTAIDDWNAYKTFLDVDLKKVSDSYGKYFASINDIKIALNPQRGLFGNLDPIANVYEDVIGQANKDLAKEYDSNRNYDINQEGGLTPTNTNIRGAAAKLPDVEQEMSDRIDNMKKVYDDLDALKNAQEAAWRDAKTKISTYEVELAAKKEVTGSDAFQDLKPEDQAKINSDITAIENALNALKHYVQDQYLAHELDLTSADYDGKCKAIDSANTKYKDDADALGGVLGLIEDFNAAKAHVARETASGQVARYNLARKFDKTFENIDNAIKTYYNEKTGNKKDIEDAIKASEVMCNNLVGAFKNVINQVDDAQRSLDTFENKINKKKVVEIDGKLAYEKSGYRYNGQSVTDFQNALDGYLTTLSEIGNGTGENGEYANPQQAYDAAMAESQKITEENYYSRIRSAQTDFLNTVTNANLQFVQDLCNDIDEKHNHYPYNTAVGMSSVLVNDLTFPKGYTGPEDITEAANDVNSAQNNESKLATCDNNLQVLADAYNEIYAEIQKIVTNFNNYDDLYAGVYSQYTGGRGLSSLTQNVINSFDDDIDDPENHVVEPAVSYYKQKVSSFQSNLNYYKNKIETAYRNRKLSDPSTFADNEKNLTDLQDEIAKMVDAMLKNQSSYDAQVLKAQSIADNANEFLAYLEDHNLVLNPDVENNREKYINDINEVLNRLADLNVELTKSYGQGQSVQHDPTYQAEFDELDELINQIIAAENSDYLNAVKQSNTLWLASNYLGSDVLKDQYNSAIEQVNEFRYNPKNADYYNMLISDPDFKKNHQDLQQCYSRINALQVEYDKYVAGLYPAGSTRDDWWVLSDNHIKSPSGGVKYSDISTEASDLHILIDQCLQGVIDAAQRVADKFYADNQGLANSIWSASESGSIYDRLLNAGLTANTTDPVTGDVIIGEITGRIGTQLATLAAIENTYNALQANISNHKTRAVNEYILEMGNIANKLNEILPAYVNRFSDVNAGTVNATEKTNYINEKVLAAVNAQWTADYNAAKTQIQNWQLEMLNYGEDPNKTDHMAALDDALNVVNTLNTNWNGLKVGDRESNFNQYDNIDLENALADARTAITDAKAAHDIAHNNNIAKFNLTDETNPNSAISQTLKDLNDLLMWSEYHPTQLGIVDGLKARIDGAEANVNGIIAGASGAVNESALKTQFTVIQTAIADAYEDVYNAEYSYANELLVLANSAFNDTKLKLDQNPDSADAPDLASYDSQIKTITTALLNLQNAYDKDEKDDLKQQLLGFEDDLCGIIAALEAFSKPGGDFGKPTLDKTIAALDGMYNELNTSFTALLNSINDQGNACNTKYGTYGTDVINQYAPTVENAISQLNQYNSDYNGLGDDVIADQDRYEWLMGQIKDEVDAIRAPWNKAQAQAKKFADSDNLYDTLVGQLDTWKADVEFAHGEAVKYESNEFLSGYYDIQKELFGEKDTSDNVLSLGYYKNLENLRKTHSVTNIIAPDFSTKVNEYVRSVLAFAALKYKDDTAILGADLISLIYNQPENDKNWKQFILNADDIVEEINTELTNLEEVLLDVIDGTSIPGEDPVDPMPIFVPNTNAQARAEYDRINAEIKDLADKMQSIYDQAVAENLYTKGDISPIGEPDGDVNILDVQALINLVGEGVELEGVDKAKADMNDDNQIDVADVTALIKYMMNPNYGNNGSFRLRSFMPKFSGNNTYRVEEVQGENGLRRFAVLLTNEVNFAAGQLDIKLPSHAHVAGVSLGERANELDHYVFENDGFTRVIITSLDSSMIDGNNGCILFIDIEGNADVEVENVIFSDENGHSYNVNSYDATGVGVIDSVKDGIKAIYNAAGQKLKKLTKGVNIIRNSDGTTTKKIGK